MTEEIQTLENNLNLDETCCNSENCACSDKEEAKDECCGGCGCGV